VNGRQLAAYHLIRLTACLLKNEPASWSLTAIWLSFVKSGAVAKASLNRAIKVVKARPETV
jgi:hypothetical protein